MSAERVLIVHNRYLQAGGEDVAVAAEAALLERYGHEVHLHESSNAELQQMSAPRAAMVTFWNSNARAQVATHAQQINADVVHFHNTFPLLSPATYYAAAENAAVVQTLHNYRLVCPAATLMRDGRPCEDCVGTSGWRGVLHGCYRDSRAATFATAAMTSAHKLIGTWARKVDAYIALTPFTRSVFVRGGLPAEKVFVKPNFFDSAEFGDAAPNEREDYFLFVGRLEEGKGIRVLLEAWRALDDAPRLKIIGSGPLDAEVRAFAASHSAVEMLGQVSRPRVIEELRRARALIAPMLWFENFPLTVCEAMACECPIIAADTANLREILNDGNAGVMFRSGDAAALAQAVLLTHMDATLRARIAAAGKQEYESTYTADANYRALRDIYGAAMSRKLVTA